MKLSAHLIKNRLDSMKAFEIIKMRTFSKHFYVIGKKHSNLKASAHIIKIKQNVISKYRIINAVDPSFPNGRPVFEQRTRTSRNKRK